MPNDAWGALMGALRVSQLIKLSWDDFGNKCYFTIIYLYYKSTGCFFKKLFREKAWSQFRGLSEVQGTKKQRERGRERERESYRNISLFNLSDLQNILGSDQS